VSATPIYDELRERLSSGASRDGSDARRNGLRLRAQPGGATVDYLAGRHGLGGRHRMPSN
jgi:hypothetical protein